MRLAMHESKINREKEENEKEKEKEKRNCKLVNREGVYSREWKRRC